MTSPPGESTSWTGDAAPPANVLMFDGLGSSPPDRWTLQMQFRE
jgi:hypothetical protein